MNIIGLHQEVEDCAIVPDIEMGEIRPTKDIGKSPVDLSLIIWLDVRLRSIKCGLGDIKDGTVCMTFLNELRRQRRRAASTSITALPVDPNSRMSLSETERETSRWCQLSCSSGTEL
jgi:hypothetical protein